jgi:hypothetical protein
MLQTWFSLVVVLLIASSAWPHGQAAGELIERTLAIVAGQVITLSDVRTALALRLIEPPGQQTDVGAGAARLVERALVLREVQRYAPPEPADSLIDEQLQVIRGRFAAPALFARALEDGGFTEARLRAWIRDDLRIAAYVNQRFAATGTPTDDEVSAYYTQRRAEFDRDGLSLEQAASLIRARLSAERRAELIRDWTADLRRRTAVVELWK